MRNSDAGPGNYRWLIGSQLNRIHELVSKPGDPEALLKGLDLAVVALQELASPHTYPDKAYQADVKRLRERGPRDANKRRLRQIGAIVRSLHRAGQLGDKNPPRGDATDYFNDGLDDEDGIPAEDPDDEDDLLST